MASSSFARSDIGQFYYAMCCETGLSLRELGEMRDEDPGQYAFIEMAFVEKNRRINEERERAQHQ